MKASSRAVTVRSKQSRGSSKRNIAPLSPDSRETPVRESEFVQNIIGGMANEKLTPHQGVRLVDPKNKIPKTNDNISEYSVSSKT